MRRIVWLLLALLTTATQAGRLTTFAWDSDPSWPPGTTIELCGTGDVCATGIVGTQHALDLPVDPGDVISGRARAVPPEGYQCGNPPALCQPSPWATVAATWPANQVGLWANREEVTSVAAQIVSGSVAKATLSNNRTITLSNYTISPGTDLALFLIWCGNYPANGDEGIATWNPGSSQSMTVIVADSNSGYGACKAFVKTNPTVGTGTITFSAAGGTSDEDNLLYAFVVSGVNQTTPTADAAGDTAGTGTSKTLTIPNMTANDLAVAAISIDNTSATVSITAGNHIGTDSTDFVSAWTDAGAAYHTGTGNVNITFGKASANGGALRFRIVGTSGGSQTYSHTASGGLASDGTAAIKRVWSYPADGGLASGGTSAIKRTQAVNASGGVTINGAAALYKGSAYLATGGIITAGAAGASLQSSSQNSHTASGGLTTGGAATFKRAWDYPVSGGLASDGTAAIKRTQAVNASGGLTINGAAALHKGSAYLATGGIITAGAAGASLQSSSQNSHVASGGLTSGGTAALRFLLDHRASGGVALGGTAAISYASLAMLLPSGLPAIERTTLLTDVVRTTLLSRAERM